MNPVRSASFGEVDQNGSGTRLEFGIEEQQLEFVDDEHQPGEFFLRAMFAETLVVGDAASLIGKLPGSPQHDLLNAFKHRHAPLGVSHINDESGMRKILINLKLYPGFEIDEVEIELIWAVVPGKVRDQIVQKHALARTALAADKHVRLLVPINRERDRV